VSNEAVQMMLMGDAFEHADVGVMVWNAERRYVAVNQAACRLLGVTREELLDQPMGSVNRSPEAQEAIGRILEEAPARGSMAANGVDLEWLVFPTSLAGLEHVVGVMWEAGTV
jgi:PAS domain-containing protein